MENKVQNLQVSILLLHNRMDSGLFNYAQIYKTAFKNSDLFLLSDLFPNSSQWRILFFFPIYKKRIRGFIKNNLKKYDLVHICDNPVYSYKILKIFKQYKINTVYTLHDPQAHLENAFKNKIKNIIIASLLKRTLKFISTSKIIKLHLHFDWPISYGIKPIILPHPIYPMENYRRRNQTNYLTIGFFGRLEYYKGYDIFIELISRLDELVDKNKVKVIIAGNGKVNQIKPYKNIDVEYYNGFIENSLFDNLLAKTDLILLPYRQSSQSGILMKALSFEVPVIVSDLNELTSYILPDITGIVLKLDDIQTWLSKIVHYSNNINELSIISQNISEEKYKYNPIQIAKKLYNY